MRAPRRRRGREGRGHDYPGLAVIGFAAAPAAAAAAAAVAAPKEPSAPSAPPEDASEEAPQ
jgi:hypothetical protein